MDSKTTGIVIKQRNLGENDRVITILSHDNGVFEAIAKGVKSPKSKLGSSCQTLSYSQFDLYKSKSNLFITSAQVVNSFYNLRLDVEKLALAGYFCEISQQLCPNLDNLSDFISLLLNSLHLLEKGTKQDIILKSIFELRSVSLAGFMPDLVCCRECCNYQMEHMFFDDVNANLICSDCLTASTIPPNIKLIKVDLSVLTAMRHIIYSPPKKIYSFNLTSDQLLLQLNYITQKYLLLNAGAKFPALTVYKDLLKGG